MKTRKPNRLNGFDYSTDSSYVITSCCKNGIHFFGKVQDGKMNLNELGNIAEQQIKWLEIQYPYIIIHNHVIMPNHIHILLEIDRSIVRTGRDLSTRNEIDGSPVRTGSDLSLPDEPKKIKSISSLIGSYKTTTSKLIHLAGNYQI